MSKNIEAKNTEVIFVLHNLNVCDVLDHKYGVPAFMFFKEKKLTCPFVSGFRNDSLSNKLHPSLFPYDIAGRVGARCTRNNIISVFHLV